MQYLKVCYLFIDEFDRLGLTENGQSRPAFISDEFVKSSFWYKLDKWQRTRNISIKNAIILFTLSGDVSFLFCGRLQNNHKKKHR